MFQHEEIHNSQVPIQFLSTGTICCS
uniref:Uncharacterized protein n=1 Tax=Rhizophora mucronata TaxID=61149 RepID=A0A2P2J9D6_RHIMU